MHVAERKTFCCARIASCGMFLAGSAAWITINTCHSIGSNGGMGGFLLPHHCMARDTSSIWVTCPSNNNVTAETTGKDSFVDSANLLGEDANLMVEEEVEGDRKQWVTQEVPESILVMVHMTGVFQHHVRWCTCNGCAKHAAASIMFVSS